jgi:Tol biopolymer transport system component
VSHGAGAAKPDRKNDGRSITASAISPDSIRAQVEKILASEHFLRAESLSRLLRFTVEQTLQGRGDDLKEYCLGVEVFSRGDSFDPRTDPIVRVQAGKLRTRLTKYYAKQGRKDVVVVEFPKGRYVPVFHKVQLPSRRNRILRGAVLVVGIATASLVVVMTVLPGHSPKSGREGVLNQLSWDAGLTTHPAISRDGNLLAYASDRSGEGNLDIWVQPGPRGQPLRLTRDSADDYEPHLSPDGSRIAFRSDRDGGGIYIVPTRGGRETLVAREAHRPRFSPDGRWLAYYVYRGGGEVYVTPSDGGHPRQIHHFAAFYPIWTPDGNHILFSGHATAKEAADWWVAPLAGGSPVKTGISAILARSGLSPSQRRYYFVAGDWAPRGNRVLFSARTGDSENLWQIAISPQTWKAIGDPERLTSGSGIEDQPSVSANGDLIFSSSGLHTDLWSLPVNANQGRVAGQVERVTRDSAFKTAPSLSLAGKTLAFVSNRSGNGDIWLKNVETGAETALASTPWPEYRPILSADGSRVAYYSFEKTQGQIYIRRLSGGAPEMVCDGCFALNDWSRDGAKMLYLLPSRPLGLALLDLKSGRKTEFLKHPKYDVGGARFSPDGRWICFVATMTDAHSRVFIALWRGDEAPPEQEWIAVTGEESFQHKPRWSPDGNLLYVFSDRDGYLCIWAQRLDPATKHPKGDAFEVYHSATERDSIKKLGLAGIDMAVAQDRLVFNSGDLSGNIWMTRIP